MRRRLERVLDALEDALLRPVGPFDGEAVVLEAHQPVAGVMADGEECLRVVHGALIGAFDETIGGALHGLELIPEVAVLMLAEHRRAGGEQGRQGGGEGAR